MNTWQNRIVGYDVVDASELVPNPANWRTHPKAQQDALTGVLGDVGWVQEIIVNKTTGHIVDGHMRVEAALLHGEKVPVKYVELSPEEELFILATIDPVSAMATVDSSQLSALLDSVNSDNEAVQTMLDDLASRNLPVSADEWDNALGGLADGDRAPFQQMTFTLHDEQAETVKQAIDVAKGLGAFVDSENENSNGNALARVCELFLGDHG